MNITLIKNTYLLWKFFGWVEVTASVMSFAVFTAKLFFGKAIIPGVFLWAPLFVIAGIYFVRVHGQSDRSFDDVSADHFIAIVALLLGMSAYGLS